MTSSRNAPYDNGEKPPPALLLDPSRQETSRAPPLYSYSDDHLPPPKSRSHSAPAHQKLKLLHRTKHNTKSREKEDDTEEWTLEGGPSNGHKGGVGGHGHNFNIIAPPEGDQLDEVLADPTTSPVDERGAPLFDSQMTEMPTRREDREGKKSKGRSLVKKTSRLFGRGDRDKADGATTPSSTSSLGAPGLRQNSYSSTTSGDSITSGSSIRNHFTASLGRPNPNSQTQTQSQSNTTKPPRSPRTKHSRRLSQDSMNSWQAPQPSIRSGVSSIREETLLPPPSRGSGANMSASVPTLSRNALPQPGPSSNANGGRQPDTIPSRMSSWFSNLLPSSSTSTIGESSTTSGGGTTIVEPPSPARRGPSAAANFLYAARQKAVDGMRHLLDSEAQPDKCSDTIWVMGVGHPGWRPSTPIESPNSLAPELPDVNNHHPHPGDTVRRSSASSGRPSPPSKSDVATIRPTAWKKPRDGAVSASASSPPPKSLGNLFSGSTQSLGLPTASPSKESETRLGAVDSPTKNRGRKEKEVIKWPEQFYTDFRSRVWFTYRSQYAPIVSLPNNLLIPTPEAYYSAFKDPADISPDLPKPASLSSSSLPSRPSTAPWNWARAGEERGLTSDAGWGCMLRTGQSMLANALVHLHLGRDWRIPIEKPEAVPGSIDAQAYATYVRLLSWFLDDPSPLSPFSVHRMALIGKELGKEVGEWFGPSTAAGALKTLANSFPPSGLAVATATDSMIYKSDVYAASNLPNGDWFDGESKPRSISSDKTRTWGDKAVLILVGLRLGLDGVNPIYYDSIKALFTFPHSVGIAGGRPSSSYYFVASQANSLFYLDPHFTRPAVPLEVPPASAHRRAPHRNVPSRRNSQDDSQELEEDSVLVESPSKRGAVPAATAAPETYTFDVVDVDDLSDSSLSSSPTNRVKKKDHHHNQKKVQPDPGPGPSPSGISVTPPQSPLRHRGNPDTPTTPLASSPRAVPLSIPSASPPHSAEKDEDPSIAWYASAYPESALRTFHCEKVKKMPLSGLDPSMLLGFLVRDQEEFDDFCERVSRLPQKIFTVQDEHPSWDEDDDAGLESVSEPDFDEASSTSQHSPERERERPQPEPDIDDDAVETSTTRTEVPIDTSAQRMVALSLKEKEKEKEQMGRPPKPRPIQAGFDLGGGSGPGSASVSWIKPIKGEEAPNGASLL